MKSPFDPISWEDYKAVVEKKSQEKLDFFNETGRGGRDGPCHSVSAPIWESACYQTWEKINKRKENIASRIDKLLKLEFLNKMDRRLNWANRSKTALYTTRAKALQYCIAELEKELLKEEIE